MGIQETKNTRPCADSHENPSEWLKTGCRLCELYSTRSDYRRIWGGTQIKVAENPTCLHLGKSPTTEQRKELSLAPTKTWNQCEHPDKPLGKEFVCPCMGCGTRCKGYSTGDEPKNTVNLRLSATGIGDAVCGLYAACGLANQGHDVTLYNRHPGWFTTVKHPRLTIVPHSESGIDISTDYNGQLAASTKNTCPTRSHWYCRNIARHLKISEFEPVRPETIDKPEPVIGNGYTLLSPFSLWSSREWKDSNWTQLARELSTDGHRVIAIGRKDDKDRLQRVFGSTPATWWWGQSEQWVCSAAANARLVIGNDSGIVHIAGMFNTPSLAIMTHMKPDFVFGSLAPSVKNVSADSDKWKCLGCAWQPNAGFKNQCKSGCGALQSINTDKVRKSLL